MQSTVAPDQLLDVDDVAAKLKIAPRKVRRMAREGGLPAIKAGRDWRFDWKAIVAYLTTTAGNQAARGSL